MATNSDSLYNVLYRIDRKPEMATINHIGYNNVVNMTFPDTTLVSEPNIYFPDNSLLVDRFSDDFVAKNSDILDRFQQKTREKDHGLESVWVTTAHILDKHEYMIELTFESSPM
ncbi:hypothetical protein FEZ51_01355 [Pediococcus stilesii]|uniref:Uncharacterized protein n=1 Tax=Pediococcus stilesii TaxID=331679 RepID=A0A5R9BZ22_9LACO|nr:hypothetical protein [Pediococcus stilesii]TLQ05330.1 hypothetical protein FEZ51_01355 [Pediococcus stilesii]